jgi:hypothetical protein
MHYSINPDDIKSEIENLGHKVANIWYIKQFRTKLTLTKFFVNLKPAPTIKDISMFNSLNSLNLTLNHQGTNGRFPNALIVNAIGTQKTTATYNCVGSNATVIA